MIQNRKEFVVKFLGKGAYAYFYCGEPYYIRRSFEAKTWEVRDYRGNLLANGKTVKQAASNLTKELRAKCEEGDK